MGMDKKKIQKIVYERNGKWYFKKYPFSKEKEITPDQAKKLDMVYNIKIIIIGVFLSVSLAIIRFNSIDMSFVKYFGLSFLCFLVAAGIYSTKIFEE